MKSFLNRRSVLDTLLNMIIELFFNFFLEGPYLKLEFVHKGENHSLRNTSRMQSIQFVGLLQHEHNLKTAYFVDF